MDAPAAPKKTTRWHLAAWLVAALTALAVTGVVLMFVFWPFRYRRVHPLLEQAFQSRVEVERYYRTYFPHPGFVADGVTFWRTGHAGEPPLAQVDHLHVVGTWTGLLFTPHTLYQIWLRGAKVRIVLPGVAATQPSGAKDRGTQQARGSDARAGVEAGAANPGAQPKNPELTKLHIETIVANGATLDLLRRGKPPVHFVFQTLQVHNLQAGQPLTFFTRARLPIMRALVEANGTLGPLRPGHFAEMPVQGSYALAGGNLHRVSELQGTASASGQYSGAADRIKVQGKLAVPNLRAGAGHVERLDAAYSATVKALQGEVDVGSAKVQMAGSTITASAIVAGNPKMARADFATTDGNLERLLEVVESGTPSVAGKVSFTAQAQFRTGRQPFLKNLRLQGRVAVHDAAFVRNAMQQKLDTLSARVRKQQSRDPLPVSVSASGETTLRDGMAYFRNLRVTLPGATAQLAGTFNLLNTRVNLAGKVAMQQVLSKDVAGWKGWLLAPLDPFFRHGKAGALVPVAVTGTAANPKIGQNLLHRKKAGPLPR